MLLAFFLFNAEEYAIWIAITLFAYGVGGATTAGDRGRRPARPRRARRAVRRRVLGDRIRRDRALALGYLAIGSRRGARRRGLALSLPIPVVYAARDPHVVRDHPDAPVHNAILPDLGGDPGAAHGRELGLEHRRGARDLGRAAARVGAVVITGLDRSAAGLRPSLLLAMPRSRSACAARRARPHDG